MGRTKLIPLSPGSKEPLPGVSWKKLISDDPADHRRWIAEGCNVACPLRENGSSAADFDKKDAGLGFIEDHAHEGIFNVVTETKRGIHVIFAGTTRTRKFEHGDIKGNGYIVFPPSVVDGWQYRFLPGYEWTDQLLPFPEHLFPDPERKPAPLPATAEIIDAPRRVTRARLYGARILCVASRAAHNTLFRYVCWMRDHGLAPAEVANVLNEWNTTNCFDEEGNPYPWSQRELTHKIESAFSLKPHPNTENVS